jgi:hypothetical protein
LVRGALVGFASEEGHELGIDEEFFATDGLFFEETDPHEFFEIDGSSLAFGNAALGQIVDPAVGPFEDEIEKFAAVNFWCGDAGMVEGSVLQFACFSAAHIALAEMHRLRTGLLSMSLRGGNDGRSLNGWSGRQCKGGGCLRDFRGTASVVSMKSKGQRYVDKTRFFRHFVETC